MKTLILITATCGMFLNCGGPRPGTPAAVERAKEEYAAEQGKTETDYVEMDADIRKSPLMMTVENRDVFRYDECVLTVNGDFETKQFGLKPDDTYIIPYSALVDDDGNRFDPEKKDVVETELYCKNCRGKKGLLSWYVGKN